MCIFHNLPASKSLSDILAVRSSSLKVFAPIWKRPVFSFYPSKVYTTLIVPYVLENVNNVESR